MHPPDLTARPDFALGDVFVHKYRKNHRHIHQLWVWCSQDGRAPKWLAVEHGHRRADGRRLTLTDGGKIPSWLDNSWFLTKEKKKAKEKEKGKVAGKETEKSKVAGKEKEKGKKKKTKEKGVGE